MNLHKAVKKAKAYLQAGDIHKAEDMFKKILQSAQHNLEALHFLSLIAYRKGDTDSAIMYTKREIGLNPSDTNLYNNLGVMLKSKGSLDEAIENFRKAIDYNPGFADAHYNLGNALHMRGELDEAITCYQTALKNRPGDYEAWNNLGNAFKEKGFFDEAKAAYNKALQINPKFGLAYSNLGTVLQDQGEFEKAQEVYQRAVDIDPHFVTAFNNMGVALREQGRLGEAAVYFEKVFKSNPRDPEAHWNMAITYLLEGRFEEGWREYEWRFQRKNVTVVERLFTQPRWNGGNIEGRTILLYAEQGMGDTVHFIRYAPLVAGQGAKVIVECQKELIPLVQSVQGVADVFEKGGELPTFDVWCPLLTLPLLFATTIETIPANVPYVHVPEKLKEAWRQKVLKDPPGCRVGLVWAGNPKYRLDRIRSCPFELFTKLRDIDGVLLYSLQKGEADEQVKTFQSRLPLIDYMDDVRDFADTAALIENLDLVISVDTAVLHVAGAMGKPAWAILPYVPDWRWMLNRSDSPWYPTMKLFRQPKFGDWESVLREVAQALREEISLKQC